ncbi:MAG: T9SS type A sorting domain-containing protein [Bacteroidetes bacterium]|nr:T9SS type A sorting domain-containing protein [Bacteroidota bacterium]
MKNFSLLVLFVVLNAHFTAAQTLPGLDPAFGNNGIVLDSDVNGDARYMERIALQYDGKVLVGGNVLTRYTSNGLPDSSFAGTGSILADNLSQFTSSVIAAIFPQPDGKIIVVGRSDSGAFAIRLNTYGSVDQGYGDDGRAHIWLGADRALQQPDGKIVVVAQVNDDVTLFRLTAQGTLDSSFGTNGSIITSNGSYQGNVSGIGLLSDGRIAIGGIGYNPQKYRSAMAMQFLPDGTPDSSFNHTGKSYPLIVDYCRATIIQPDGKLLLAIGGLTGDAGIMRLKLDGSIDSTYGQDGFATVPSVRVTAMHLTPDEKLLCGGYDGDFVAARLMPEGTSLDSTFGQNGVRRTDVSGTKFDEMYTLAMQPDGKILGGGMSSSGGQYRLTLVRWLADAATGIRPKMKTSVRIYPNPVHNEITIDFGQTPSGRCIYSIRGMDGRLLRSCSLANNRALIDVSYLEPGSYLLSISSPSFNQSILFTKQ